MLQLECVFLDFAVQVAHATHHHTHNQEGDEAEERAPFQDLDDGRFTNEAENQQVFDGDEDTGEQSA